MVRKTPTLLFFMILVMTSTVLIIINENLHQCRKLQRKSLVAYLNLLWCNYDFTGLHLIFHVNVSVILYSKRHKPFNVFKELLALIIFAWRSYSLKSLPVKSKFLKVLVRYFDIIIYMVFSNIPRYILMNFQGNRWTIMDIIGK